MNFFAQLGDNVTELLEHYFFLVYYGKGLTMEDVRSMASDQRLWYIRRLRQQYEEENKIREDARRQAEMAAKQNRRR